MPNGNFLREEFTTFGKIDENALRGFRAQISYVGIIVALDRPDVSFEHQVEQARFGEFARLSLASQFRRLERTLRCAQMIGAKAAFTGFAID